ncbi:MAG: LPS translocon maturation chaperone LptM [Gammaproteobacteria bacterium]
MERMAVAPDSHSHYNLCIACRTRWFMIRSPRRLALALAAAMLVAGAAALSGCGQTGPLYLPPPKPKPVKPKPVKKASTPVSSPSPQTTPSPSTAGR